MSLFLSWQHPLSKRFAILEDCDGMVWLYLTGSGTRAIEKDCPAFLTREASSDADWATAAKKGVAPSITKKMASSEAVRLGVNAKNLSAAWDLTGESVATVLDGQVIAMILAGHERGYSRALNQPCALGQPFDEQLAAQVFAKP